MPKLPLALILTLILAGCSKASSQNPRSASPSQPVLGQTTPNNQDSAPSPQFTLKSLSTGKVVDAAHFAGKPTLLKLGTTYCHVCMQEVPEMKAAHQELGDSANIVFVLIGASESDAKAYQQRYDLPYEIYTDQGTTARTFDVLGTPTHAVLDPDGQLVLRRVGFMSKSQITASLRSLL